ncbi:MAG: hypothetical protein ACRDTC_06665 [Pseudonocardiaceae bacterium]
MEGISFGGVGRELERRDPAAVEAVIGRSRERFRTVGAFESAHLVRADRDSRPRWS